jgi:rod shape-determining protein MreB and related proteins
VNQPVTYVGLDLGTFKTSVASSNGKRFVIPSVVGWPKDRVARALLGRDLVFGEEALKHQSALNVIRPFHRGALKYVDGADVGIRPEDVAKHKEAALLLVQHVVSDLELPAGRPIYGIIGAPSRATVFNKQVIINAARRTLDAVMVVADPFNIANGMNQLSNSMVIDIGAGTIDICPVCGTYPKDEDQITLPVGGDLIDDELHRLIKQSEPYADLSLNQARQIKEKFGFVRDDDEPAIATLQVDGKPTQVDVSKQLNAACRSIVPGITEALLELVSKFDRDFQKLLFNNIVLGGGGSQLKGLDQQIEQALQKYGQAKVTQVHDPVFAGANGALKMAMSMPADYWQQIVAQAGNKKQSNTQRARVSLSRAAGSPARPFHEQLKTGNN